MPTLKSKQVQIFDTPNKAINKTCSSRWDKSGTCCEVKSLVGYSQRDSASITSALNQAMNSIYRIAIYINQTISMAGFLTKQNIGWIGLIVTYHQVYMWPHMEHFRQTLVSIPKDFKPLLSNGASCWSTISKIRALSLCSTCSGKSDVFFTSRSALIRLSTCRDIMSSCENHMLSLIRFVIRSTEFFAGIHEYGVVKQAIQVDQNQALVEEIYHNFQAIKKLELLKVVHQYMESKDKSKDKTSALVKICEATTDLAQDAFVVKVLPILKKIELLSKELKNIAVAWTRNKSEWKATENGKDPKPILAELDSITKEPSQPARLLQSTSGSQLSESSDILSAFKGDVNVFESGISHSNKDTSSNYVSLNNSPEPMDINLKHAFP